MSPLPTISVVTPCFNMKSYIGRTIRATLANLAPGDEYIVIDGGSTDGTTEVIAQHANELTYWTSEPDRGYADALAKGFARATGDILCWINASDLHLGGTFDRVRTIFASSDVDLVFGDDFYIDEQDRVISFSRGYVHDLRAAMLYGGWAPLQDACFWRRNLYVSAGGMDVSLKYAADYDLFLRMSGRGRSSYIPMAFSAFRRHAEQKSISGKVAYRHERMAVRAREQAGDSALGAWKWGARAIHAFAIRWRLHVLQKLWTRPDLSGRNIATLEAGRYWPKLGA